MDQLNGFSVDWPVDFDDSLWVLALEIASQPFLLNRAGDYLVRATDYPPIVMDEWEADNRKQFGGERLEAARIEIFEIQRKGIYLAAVKPGIVPLAEEPA